MLVDKYVAHLFYTYVTNQQMHIDRICFIILYYTPIYFGCFCSHHLQVIQEYKQYTNNCTIYIITITYCYS